MHCLCDHSPDWHRRHCYCPFHRLQLVGSLQDRCRPGRQCMLLASRLWNLFPPVNAIKASLVCFPAGCDVCNHSKSCRRRWSRLGTCRNWRRACEAPRSLASDRKAQMASSVSEGFTATSSLNCIAAASYCSTSAASDLCCLLICDQAPFAKRKKDTYSVQATSS